MVSTVNTLLSLSNADGNDAIKVLHDKGLHVDAELHLLLGVLTNQAAIGTSPALLKRLFIQAALSEFQAARTQYGTGLNFSMGEGNLLF